MTVSPGGALAYADGRLFVAAGNGTVFGLDAGSGAEVWRRPIRAPIRAAPTVAEGKVLVPTADGQLYALDAGSGEVALAACRPVRAGRTPGRRLAGGGRRHRGRRLPSGEVVALSLASGEQLWSDTGPAATAHAGDRGDRRHRRRPGDRRRSGVRRRRERRDGGVRPPARRPRVDRRRDLDPDPLGRRQLPLRADRARRGRVPDRPGRQDPMGDPACLARRSGEPGFAADPMDRPASGQRAPDARELGG